MSVVHEVRRQRQSKDGRQGSGKRKFVRERLVKPRVAVWVTESSGEESVLSLKDI